MPTRGLTNQAEANRLGPFRLIPRKRKALRVDHGIQYLGSTVRRDTRATRVVGPDAALLPKLSVVSLCAAVWVIRTVRSAIADRNVMVRPSERDKREMGERGYRPHLHRQGIHPRPRERNYFWRNESASIASSWNLYLGIYQRRGTAAEAALPPPDRRIQSATGCGKRRAFHVALSPATHFRGGGQDNPRELPPRYYLNSPLS